MGNLQDELIKKGIAREEDVKRLEYEDKLEARKQKKAQRRLMHKLEVEQKRQEKSR